MLAQDFLENFNNQLILKPATGLAGPNPCFDMMSSLDSKKGKVDHAWTGVGGVLIYLTLAVSP